MRKANEDERLKLTRVSILLGQLFNTEDVSYDEGIRLCSRIIAHAISENCELNAESTVYTVLCRYISEQLVNDTQTELAKLNQ